MKRCYLAIVTLSLTLTQNASFGQSAKEVTNKEVTNSIDAKFVLIPQGKFTMGALDTEDDSEDDEIQHQVTISKPFYLGVHEVTQGQYEQVMGTNPSHFQKRVIRKNNSSNYPVEQVSWDDAIEFCKKLSDNPKEKAAKRVYRLPTEAEWEWACRAGGSSAYAFGDSKQMLGDYAWFQSNSDRKTHPVGSLKPNAWGLFDMHGNVWEWCQDFYGDYPKTDAKDPTGPSVGTYRVNRGGGWIDEASSCRSSHRFGDQPDLKINDIGFRVVMTEGN